MPKIEKGYTQMIIEGIVIIESKKVSYEEFLKNKSEKSISFGNQKQT